MTLLQGNYALAQFNLLRVHRAFKAVSKLNSPFLIVAVEAPSGQSFFSSLWHYHQLFSEPFCWFGHLSGSGAQSFRNSERTLRFFPWALKYKLPWAVLRLTSQGAHVEEGAALCKRGARPSWRMTPDSHSWPEVGKQEKSWAGSRVGKSDSFSLPRSQSMPPTEGSWIQVQNQTNPGIKHNFIEPSQGERYRSFQSFSILDYSWNSDLWPGNLWHGEGEQSWGKP